MIATKHASQQPWLDVTEPQQEQVVLKGKPPISHSTPTTSRWQAYQRVVPPTRRRGNLVSRVADRPETSADW